MGTPMQVPRVPCAVTLQVLFWVSHVGGLARVGLSEKTSDLA